MKKKASSILLAAALAMSMLVTGCGTTEGTGDVSNANQSTPEADSSGTDGQASAETGESGETFMAEVVNVGLQADVSSLNPYASGNVGSLHVMPEIFQTLFYAPEFGADALPMVGKSYTVSDDYLSCDVEIFDNVYDSEGNHVTAEDIKFSFDTGAEGGAIKQLVQYYDSCEVVDDYHVTFHINKAALGVWEEMFENTYIVDSDAYDADAFATKPVGTGPYKVVEYISGSGLSLEYNENFWQTDEAYLNPVNQHNVKKINYKIITENAQMTMALQTGDIDLACSISATDAQAYFLSDDNYTVLEHPTNLYANTSFNMSGDSVVSNSLELRQAILYSINVDDIISGIFAGAAEKCYTLGGSMYSDYNEEWEGDYYDYNPEKAAELLDAAGYVDVNGDGFREQPDGSEMTVRIILETNDTKNRVAQYMQGCMQEVGVKATITQYDAALFSQYKWNFDEWDMIIDAQANRASLAAAWGTFIRQGATEWKGKTTNAIGMVDDELEALLTTAVDVQTNSQEAVDAVHEYMKDNALYYGLYCEMNYKIGQSGIEEIFINNKMYPMAGACTYASDYQSRS